MNTAKILAIVAILLLITFVKPEKAYAVCGGCFGCSRYCQSGTCQWAQCNICFDDQGNTTWSDCNVECSNWWDCVSCSPNCGSPLCGQGDGCGGGCSSQDNQWTWGACSPVTFQRTATNPCQGGTQTENCLGTITGTIFDATDIEVCPGSFAGLGINGGTVTATGTAISYNDSTDANGFYTIPARSPDTYTLTVDPGSDFVTMPKLICQGSTVTLTGQGESATRDFGYLRIYGGWFQAINGSVYGRTGVRSTIPGTMSAADRHLILSNANGTDGLALYKTGTLNLGNYPGVTVSELGFNANSGYDGDAADYKYWKVKMATFDKTVWNGLGQPVYDGGANNYQIYTYTGDVTMNWSPAAGERVVYLIDGNVTISGNITVPTSSPSFLMVAANGSITFNTSVTDVDGWWVGNSINIPCVDTAPNDGICDETDVQFRGNGSFVGYNSITLSRDQNIGNNTQPSEKFTYRPDLMVNAPEPLRVSKYIWRYQ